MKKTIVIDGKDFSDLEGFFCLADRLFRAENCAVGGHNLDAFNDLLGGGFGVHEPGEPIIIKWINFGISRNALGYEATAEYYENKLEKTRFTDNFVMKKRMEQAKDHQGRTLLDMITSIIINKDSGHDCELIIME